MKVYIVPFTEIQMQIHEKCPEEYGTLVMRRYMMRIADARSPSSEGAKALITGESLGQVASQTHGSAVLHRRGGRYAGVPAADRP